ncbi:amidohydrolase family protein [Mucilaginibacter sp. McL0603]|uniref:amidohydrolase family protein n=1 Tax=Mucilaginibacter sp. McL0603 TaxID=3415670 RepID=UPI003CEF0E7C
MVLNNLRIALTDQQVSIRVNEGKIAQILPAHFHDKNDQHELNFDNAIVFPGLINSHDHLDFNLFPSLGDRTYNNYTEWGRHIHKNYKDKINEVLKVPEALREQWGVYKNLLCGVTTVVNHGKKIKNPPDIITVYQDCQSIHSVQFEKKWRLALNRPFRKQIPVVIHSGEGTDEASFKEISTLAKWNLFKRPLIAVHGVAMNETQAKDFKALVWCPESNYFLLDRTAPVNRLKKYITVLFGTDSTLTGNWDLWDHVSLARKTKFLTDKELYDTLTVNAANTWQLNSGEIAEGRDADLVIAKSKHGLEGADAFFSINPEDILLVMHKGNISLFDEELYPQLKELNLIGYSKVFIDGTYKYVRGNLSLLMQNIKRHYPKAEFPVL